MCLIRLFSGFFFFKQKTAYEMRISDWSSDVCSSDLKPKERPHYTTLTKILLTMKLTLFMLFILVVTVNAEGMAQKVSLSLKNVKIEEVFTKDRKSVV